MEDDEFDEEDLVPDTKSKNQENRNRSNHISPMGAIGYSKNWKIFFYRGGPGGLYENAWRTF